MDLRAGDKFTRGNVDITIDKVDDKDIYYRQTSSVYGDGLFVTNKTRFVEEVTSDKSIAYYSAASLAN